MTIINPNSISGISSITALNSTAAINLFKADGTSANIIAGVTTGANFITGTSNVHSTGYECTNINASGIITATSMDMISTDAGSSAAPEFKLFRNSASPDDADYLGQIKFAGESDTGVERNYAKITGKILDASNGTEDGILEFAHIKGGSQTITGRWRSDSLQLLNSTNLTVDGDIDVDGHTNLDNVSIAGVTTTSDTIKIKADNKYLSIGAHNDGDMLLYHDGNKSVLVNYTGDFHIRTNNGSRSSLEGIILKPNGATEIYHSGNKIIETDSLGVNVDGRLDVVGTGANDHLNVGTNTGRLRIGGYADLQLYHDSTNINYISNHNDIDLHITSTYGGSPVKTQAKFIHNGAVELYHNNFKTINTNTNGITLTAPEGGDCVLDMNADEGDDNPDKWRLNVTQGGSFQLRNYADGSWENHIQTTVNSSVQLYNNGNVKLETTSSGITVTGGITANANSAYSASIVFSDATGIRLSHSNQSDGNDGTIAAGSFASGLNIVGTRTLSSGNRQVRMWGDVFPSSNGAEKLGLSGNRWSKLYVNQILFNGDTASQNELDDYEEGTATFALHINGSEPSGISYSYNTAPYVKVGRMVYCAVSMFATSVPADTGSIDIQGLPFTDGGGGGYREPAFLAANHGGAGTYVISGALHGNNTKIRIRKNGNQDLDGSDIGSTFWMHGHITYKANV